MAVKITGKPSSLHCGPHKSSCSFLAFFSDKRRLLFRSQWVSLYTVREQEESKRAEDDRTVDRMYVFIPSRAETINNGSVNSCTSHCAITSLSCLSWYCHMQSGCSKVTCRSHVTSGSIRTHKTGESELWQHQNIIDQCFKVNPQIFDQLVGLFPAYAKSVYSRPFVMFLIHYLSCSNILTCSQVTCDVLLWNIHIV